MCMYVGLMMVEQIFSWTKINLCLFLFNTVNTYTCMIYPSNLNLTESIVFHRKLLNQQVVMNDRKHKAIWMFPLHAAGFEVSKCTFPIFQQASAAPKHHNKWLETIAYCNLDKNISHYYCIGKFYSKLFFILWWNKQQGNTSTAQQVHGCLCCL